MKDEITKHIEAFLLSRRNAGRSERTVDWYSRHILDWLRWLQTANRMADWLTAEALDSYLEHERGRGLADSSVHACYRCLRAFLRWLRKRKRIAVPMDDLPTAMVDAPEVKAKKPRQADYEDLQKVIDSIHCDHWLDYRDRCVLALMLTTGLRVDEAVSVRVEDINTKEGFVFVADGKGEKPRIVPFDGQFKAAFTAWIYNRPATTNGKLFVAADRWQRATTEPISTATVRQMLMRRCAKIGVKYINPHSIRHLFAIKALNDGVQLSAVSAMLGHESTAFTARVYAKWVQAGLRKEYDNNWKVKSR